MARVLAVSSLVARGHVGLSAMVPALQALGHDVTALPTIVLAHHPGHPHAAGERVAPATLARMLAALDANGWLAEVDAIVTGYLPSVEHVGFAAAAIDRVRQRRPDVIVLVDAVLGDEPKGLYIAADAAAAMRDRLVGAADILKGNAFEIGWLAGPDIEARTDAEAARRAIGARELVATSRPTGTPGIMANALAGPEPRLAPFEVRAAVPKGTGDLLAALLLGHLLAGDGEPPTGTAGRTLADAFTAATAAIDAVVRASVGADELRIVDALPPLVAARRRPGAARLSDRGS